MKKNVLIVHAHPDPRSLNRQLVDAAVRTLREQGHDVVLSDLYGMRWKAVFDEHDFPSRADPDRLSFIRESGHSYATGRQAADIAAEQQKVLAADAVILQFPLWWFGMPAILKGWVDRVWAHGLAYGYKSAGNRYRYGDGAFKGKRALLSVTVGGPAEDYSPRGINGPLEQLLFPITHGTLFFPGMEVLPTHAVYGAESLTPDGVASEIAVWRSRVERLFLDSPIPFRSQNGGDYPDRHVLASDVAVGQTGLTAHIAELPGSPDDPRSSACRGHRDPDVVSASR